MFCCVRQLKLPFNQSYVPLKCVSLRTQSYPKTPYNREITPSYNDIESIPTVRRSMEHFMFRVEPVLKHDLIPYNILGTRELLQLTDDLLRLQLLVTTSTPQKERRITLDSNSKYSIVSEVKYSAIRHDVMVFTENESLQDVVRSVHQPQRKPSVLPDFQVCCSSVQCADGTQPSENRSGRPTEDQLLKIQECLVASLPGFFKFKQNFSIYHQNLVFHNNITRVSTRGLPAYVRHLFILRFLAHLKYFSLQMHILKVTNHPEDGTVRVRWRVSGIPNIKALSTIVTLKRSGNHKKAEWIDGFSIFSVGPDGLVYKHLCDKVMPDESAEKVVAGPLGVKFAVAFGFLADGYMPT